MNNEVPIKIIPGKGMHKTETRVFARNIHEAYCIQPGCKFKGKKAQQGVCHTTKPWVGGKWDYLDAVFVEAGKAAKELLASSKKYSKSHKDYVKNLEEHIAVDWVNTIFHIDGMIRMRREVALLRVENERLKAKLKERKS